MRNVFLAGAAGAALAYFLDPEQGAGRRNMARDRLMSMLRRGGGQVAEAGRGAAAQTVGFAQQAVHMQAADQPALDDVTLARKVESELFRDADVPKGQVNVSVENGVV